MPTASAICGDILFAARAVRHTVPSFRNTAETDPALTVTDDWSTRYFIRMKVTDAPGVLARIADVFGQRDISLAAVMQKGSEGEKARLVLITHKARERAVREAIAALDPAIAQVVSCIRVENGEA